MFLLPVHFRGCPMNFTKKIRSLLSLIASIVFNKSIGVENYIIGLVNKIQEAGRVLIKTE